VGVEPTEAFKLRQFSGLLGVPVPNLPRMAGAPGFEPRNAGLESASLAFKLTPPRDASGRTRTSTLNSRATALQATAKPLRPLMQKLLRLRLGKNVEGRESPTTRPFERLSDSTTKSDDRRRAKKRTRAHVESSPPSILQGTSIVKHQKSGPLGFSTEKQARSEKSLLNFLEILGAGGRSR
jgi:hypothetical protein